MQFFPFIMLLLFFDVFLCCLTCFWFLSWFPFFFYVVLFILDLALLALVWFVVVNN